MALFKKKTEHHKHYKTVQDTGLGTNSSYTGGRFYNKDGTMNVKKVGIPWISRNTGYHFWLSISSWKFISLIVFGFVVINLFFTFIYLLIGIENLHGMIATSFAEKFAETFFFSVQTFTTVGYGRINPMGLGVNIVASFEALTGLSTLALITGLIYGRFSKPQFNIRYSHNALISPYKTHTGLMFRVVSPQSFNQLSDLRATVNCAMEVMENGVKTNKFYNLKLELETITSLALSWTVVHHINPDSPLWGMELEDFRKANIEILILIRAFDEIYSNMVISRTSYTANEIVVGAKFVIMYHENADDTSTILDLHKLNTYEKVGLPKKMKNKKTSI